MRRYEDLDDLQQKAIDALYNNDERLALRETGYSNLANSPKSLIAAWR